MAEVALGWLGWSEDQALRADVNAIRAGYDGKLDMFTAIGWMSPNPVAVPAEATPQKARDVFDATWG